MEGAATASVTGPGVLANVQNIDGFQLLTANVIDVLSGTVTSVLGFNAEGYAAGWSVIVGCGVPELY